MRQGADPPADEPPVLSVEDLRRLPPPDAWPADCACAKLRCAGWESVSAPLGGPAFRLLGSLRAPGDEEPTPTESPGSRYWAAEAPLAPAYFPYNRCSVWVCADCGRGFVQYTEFGGYYLDHRLRQIDPALVV